MQNALITLIVVTVLFGSATAQCGEFTLHPAIAVSEEYTDNVFETGTNRTSDFITRLLPGVSVSYQAPALTGDLGYIFDYRHYARKTREDEITHSLSAKAKLIAVENLLFLDVSDEYQRVSLDVTRDVTKESLFFNQSDRNVVIASPYFILHPTERILLKPGYRFIDTRYFSSSGIDKIDHIAFLSMNYELSKRWSLTADYTFTRELAAIGDYSQHLVFGGFRYEYTDKSFVFAQAGSVWITYNSGHSLNNIIWNAGFTHVFDTVTATIMTGVKYNEDPLKNSTQESFVSGVLEKRFQRSAVSISPYYSEFVPTDTGTNTAQTKKYGATAQGRYEILTDLNGKLGITAEKYELPQIGRYTRRFQLDTGLSYLLGNQLTASLSYIYTDYYSPDIATDNHHVNRGMVELKKTF